MGAGADQSKLPKLYWVNWFRKGEDGSFLWPGYGDNSRVLKWIIERLDGTAEAQRDRHRQRAHRRRASTSAGLDLVAAEAMEQLTTVDDEAWREELPLYEQHYASIGERLPEELRDELRDLEKRLAG